MRKFHREQEVSSANVYLFVQKTKQNEIVYETKKPRENRLREKTPYNTDVGQRERKCVDVNAMLKSETLHTS